MYSLGFILLVYASCVYIVGLILLVYVSCMYMWYEDFILLVCVSYISLQVCICCMCIVCFILLVCIDYMYFVGFILLVYVSCVYSVCLFGVLRHFWEFFIHMETFLLPVKGWKFWSILDTHGHWAARVLKLLWHGASVYNGHLRGPVTLTSVAERLEVALSLSIFTT